MKTSGNFLTPSSEKVVLFFLFIFSSLLLAINWHQLFLLRPVSDDYCFAASLSKGVLTSFNYWFDNVQFDFLVLAANLLFVALPIIVLPTSIASLVSLIVMVCIFSFFSSRLLLPKDVGIHFLFTFVTIIYGIFTYFFLQVSILNFIEEKSVFQDSILADLLIRINQHTIDVSNSWSFWGVVNSSYLIMYVFTFVFLWKRSRSPLNFKVDLPLAFLVGTTGYVSAATTLCTYLVISVLFPLDGQPTKKFLSGRFVAMKILKLSPVILTVIAGASISFFSPGAFARRNALANLPDSAQSSLGEIFIDIGRVLAEVFLNFGNFSAVLIGSLIGLLIKQAPGFSFSEARLLLKFLLVYFVVCFFFTILSEFFSYRAYWHTFTLKFDLFLILITWGILQMESKKFARHYVVLSITAIFISFIAFLGFSHQIENRYSFWLRGENYGALSSVGIKSGWVYECFKELNTINPKKYYAELR